MNASDDVKTFIKMSSSIYLCFFFRIIDGFDTLDALEKIPVDENTYRPVSEIKIRNVTIHANPIAG